MPIYMCQSTTSSSEFVADEYSGESTTFTYSFPPFSVGVSSGKDVLKRLQHAGVAGISSSEVSTTFPNTYMKDVYSNYFDKVLVNVSNYGMNSTTEALNPICDLVLEIDFSNAKIKRIKLPGMGILSFFNSEHPCFKVEGDEVCDCLNAIKWVGPIHALDVIPVAHRGVWGVTGVPENSEKSMIEADAGDVNYVEVDIMKTKDGRLICMHDYNLERLTSYTGETAYIFDKTYQEISDLFLRNRDETISSERILEFSELVDIVKSRNLVLMMDIKELQPRMVNGTCVANCDYQSKEKQTESWRDILHACYAIVKEKGAMKNVVLKTYYSPSELSSLLPQGISIHSILVVPMLISRNFSNNINSMCDFVDSWTGNYGNSVSYFETDFFNSNDIQLHSFSRNNRNYENILHYLYCMGFRGGIFSEEPVGRKGVVNRWAEWKMKNTRSDVRGDHIFLMNVPYANSMVITTDRVDIWKQIMNTKN